MSTDTKAVVPVAGQMVRQDATGEEITGQAETAGAALAAQARAMVEARFVMALRKPRDWDEVRAKLLRACDRPGFAGSATEKTFGAAWYRKPIGEGIEGFSIRFAEEAVRCMGNVDVQTVTVYDDDTKRICMVTVTDLENNSGYQASFTFNKTVERRSLKDGEKALSVRVGSFGKPVYTMPATDDDVFTKQQALASKLIRNGVLRVLPGDIQAVCRDRILAIRQGDIAKDLDGARLKLVDAFGALNILPTNLKELLGHELTLATPAEIDDLRALYKALKAGETTWADAVAEALADRGETADAKPRTTGLAAVTEKLKAQEPTKGLIAPGELTHAEADAAIAAEEACHHTGAFSWLVDKNKKPIPGKVVSCADCERDVHLVNGKVIAK